MRGWFVALLKFLWGAYFLVASLYCFLAYIPYTYFFVIQSPPYAWLVFLSRHNVLLLWMAVCASAAATRMVEHRWRSTIWVEAVFALVLSLGHPITHIQNNDWALFWSFVYLVPLFCTAAADFRTGTRTENNEAPSSISITNAVLIGALAALISYFTPDVRLFVREHYLLFGSYESELLLWILVEHITIAVGLITAMNLLRQLYWKLTRQAEAARFTSVAIVLFFALAAGCAAFVRNSCGLPGLQGRIYATAFAAGIVLCVFAVAFPLMLRRGKVNAALFAAIAIIAIVGCAYLSLTLDPVKDWNGLIASSVVLVLWLAIALIICFGRPRAPHYSTATLLAVAILTGAIYELVLHTRTVWAGSIGGNVSQISREFNVYTRLNQSFALTDRMLGNQTSEDCDAACKTLRQYSNIRNARLSSDLSLVDDLKPTAAPKPNIFVVVIDSVRPDYLGVYNPRVDFTPNIDRFARESVVMREAYSNYSGTSLSETAIWTGALQLHAHYPQPFSRINTLEKLLRCDGYQAIVSYDEVLRVVVPAEDPMTKLDADEPLWVRLELSKTLRQLEPILDRRDANAGPLFFYVQPKNVHGHADNDLPKRTPQNWKSRPGFDDRIAYTLWQTDAILGDFFNYLKSRKMYDDSIIIVTSDHGEATGELGRLSHSTSIYPEIMKVPLIVHLPASMRGKFVYDENRLTTLTDITPSLYYLLGHGETKVDPMLGRPIFVVQKEELDRYPRPDLFLASDEKAIFGILTGDERYMYTTYDAPARSMLFDLAHDPTAQHNVLTPELKQEYDRRVFEYLEAIDRLYGYQPTGGQ